MFYNRVLTLMAFSSLFNKVAHGGEWWQTLVVMCLPMITVTPLNILIKMLLVTKIRSTKMILNLTRNDPRSRDEELKKRKRAKKIALIKMSFGYILVIASIAASIYSVLVVAANSSIEDSQNWAKNFMISISQDMVTSQIIKVLLTVFLFKCFVNAKNKCAKFLLKILVDPLTARALAMISLQHQYQIGSL